MQRYLIPEKDKLKSATSLLQRLGVEGKALSISGEAASFAHDFRGKSYGVI
jgi:hypothetical protein